MKILRLFEKAWIAALICAFAVAIFNFFTLFTFDYRVYFPFFCGIFCTVIWRNLRGQRKFYEKLHGKENQAS
ncbi:MAG: hypothetical protein M9931_00920 [Chitinophagales bacterium]|nr:hypothetical protein [Chitinophagales bacterium]MCO5279597.1 hypothetical protein [Chitinophagales bacterium]OJV24184.1 MAG: hypothetical protein BGO32_04030 [Bacteroidetes bacterium 37-13]HRN94041.1 hypothetical protein [Chitinophagales bacterium]HRP40046.1 hypothetical protein [Chitinophagales bacterium]